MKSTTVKVKNCRGCPFSEFKHRSIMNRVAYGTCLAPVEIHDGKYNITSAYKEYKKPNWCPLTKTNVTIKLA